MKRLALLILLTGLLVACGQPVDRRTQGTLTAGAVGAAPVQTAVPTQGAEPTATKTSTVQASPTPVPALTEVPVTPSPTAHPSAAPTAVSYRPELYAVVGVAWDDVLNVRSGPGVGNPIVGTVPPAGQGLRVGVDGQQVAGSLWVPVWYEGVEGWANASYLVRQAGQLAGPALSTAHRAILAIRDKDWPGLAGLVDPELGVRFSPYPFVRETEDLVFGADDVRRLWADGAFYTWGSFDGSGEPITMTFAGYYARFVYDADFAQPQQLGLDEVIGSGNSLDNLREVYPGAVVVDYHFEGFDSAYGGMDWRSLRLVFQERGGMWYLVGVVHGEWTI